MGVLLDEAVAGVGLAAVWAADGKAGDGGDVAGGVDLAHAVVERVGEELVAVGVEDDVGRSVEGDGGCGAEVAAEPCTACACVTGAVMDQGESLTEGERRQNRQKGEEIPVQNC